MADEPVIVLFHYTDKMGADAIKKSCKINQSKGGPAGDAVFGKGVYLTSIGMDVSAEVVAKNNWKDKTLPEQRVQEGRLDYAIQVTIKESKVTKMKQSRDIYLYKGDLNLNGDDVTKWQVISRN